MPPEVRDPTDPREWLRRARSNLALAQSGRSNPEVLYEDLCFEAQQAAEKAIKAVLVMRQVEFPKTHLIVRLLDLVEQAAVTMPSEMRAAARLSDYATRARYPGGAEEVAEDEYRQAVAWAEQAVRWAEHVVGSAAP